jgi:transcriptional accessory protein Tex/SPT6
LSIPSIGKGSPLNSYDKANEQALNDVRNQSETAFASAPLKGKPFGLDPLKNGLKVAVINSNGDVLGTGVVYPILRKRRRRCEARLYQGYEKYNVEVSRRQRHCIERNRDFS